VAANFHLWQIKEIYSNADGSVQFIELFTTSDGQTVLTGHQIVASSGDEEVTFTFPADLVGSTTSKHLLIATPGFAALPGAVTPNYTLPCLFFDPAATSITIDFVGADDVTFAGASLPTDGTNSLTDTNLPGPQNLQSSASSPRNFAGATGALALTGCLQLGTCEPCDDGRFCNGSESCAASACVAGTPPCIGMCSEAGDSCGAELIELDIDGNGLIDALTDGLLVLRYLFGFNGATLTTGAVGDGCTRCDAATIQAYLGTLDF
jgi:hypothetical protein